MPILHSDGAERSMLYKLPRHVSSTRELASYPPFLLGIKKVVQTRQLQLAVATKGMECMY